MGLKINTKLFHVRKADLAIHSKLNEILSIRIKRNFIKNIKRNLSG